MSLRKRRIIGPSFTFTATPIVVAGPTYIGPGDVTGSADFFFGLRGYSGSYASSGINPAIDVVHVSTGSPTTTIVIKPDGTLDVATIAALGYSVRVSKWYDQSGNGKHVTQSTLTNMPNVILNAFGSLPTIKFSNDQLGAVTFRHILTSSSTVTRPQPFVLTTLLNRLSTEPDATKTAIIQDNNFGCLPSGNTGGLPDLIDFNCGGDNQLACTSDAFHAVQWHGGGGVHPGDNYDSRVRVDASETYGWDDVWSAGTGGWSGTFSFGDRAGAGGSCHIGEMGLWPGPWDSTARGNMHTNMKTYWGTP